MGSLSTVFTVFPELEKQLWRQYIKAPDGTTSYYMLSDTIKEYTHMLQIVIYHESYRVSTLPRSVKKANKKIDKTHRSARRSKTAVHDIVMSNQWDYWCTFTFSPKKVDRENYNRVALKMNRWLHRQKDLRYIIVPEYHKKCSECALAHADSCPHDDRDKPIHFHALIANYEGKLKDTKHTTKHGQKIFRGNFAGGHHEFVQLDGNKEAIATYMIKQYITKDNIQLFGRKRYWTSRGLDRPVSYINALTRYNLWGLVKNRKPDYINEHYEIYQIPKTYPLLKHGEQMTMM